MSEDHQVFDHQQLARQRLRASRDFARHDFMFRELAARLIDRLADVRRAFPNAADLSPQPGLLGEVLAETRPAPGGIANLRAAPLVEGEVGTLPFEAGSLDLILVCLGLHWINDLPGALIQIRNALRPDGLFLGVMLGGETLTELRQCLMEAELAETGGASPRVSPMVGLRDAAGLLQRAGFALPVADAETLNVTYPDVLALMRDLRGMGEGNALIARSRRPLSRNVIARASQLYAERFGAPDGRIQATFQAIFLTGWAPDPSQQQPARRGSGEVNLNDVFGRSC